MTAPKTISAKDTAKAKDDDEISEDIISEDIDEFLNSSGGASLEISAAASEDFTKDETLSDGKSLKADYAEKM